MREKDGEFRVEYDRPEPEQEIEFCEGKIKESEKEKVRLEKLIEKLRSKPKLSLMVQVQDANGEVVQIKGKDGKLYDHIEFTGVDGDNVSSLMSMATVALKSNLGSTRNEVERNGSLIHACDKQIIKYKERIERAKRHLRAKQMRSI